MAVRGVVTSTAIVTEQLRFASCWQHPPSDSSIGGGTDESDPTAGHPHGIGVKECHRGTKSCSRAERCTGSHTAATGPLAGIDRVAPA
jgi:hypothetical protein